MLNSREMVLVLILLMDVSLLKNLRYMAHCYLLPDLFLRASVNSDRLRGYKFLRLRQYRNGLHRCRM